MLDKSIVFEEKFVDEEFETTTLYFIAPKIQLKNVVLLLMSLIFYSWGEPRLVVLMIVSVGFGYVFGLLMEK